MAAKGHRVLAFCMHQRKISMPGVRVVIYKPGKGSTKGVHPWASDFETKVIRGAVAFKAARKMRDEHGFQPDIIVAHPGWGESLFLKEAWPNARIILFCEWYYGPVGDSIFDPEFQSDSEESRCRVLAKNAANLLSMNEADGGLCPTEWQKSTFPEWFRGRINVIHDGINTSFASPAERKQPLELKVIEDKHCGIEEADVKLDPNDEIITFVNRNLEPYRGYHGFMRLLPRLMKDRPRLKVVIVGGNENSYGGKPESGTWKQIFLDEVRSQVDMRRIYFVGKIPHSALIRLFQMTSVHVYYTYPFVLSWSLMEAMSCAAPIVACDTQALREVIDDGVEGLLVDFFDLEGQLKAINRLLDDPELRESLGTNARKRIVDNYDLERTCLPQQIRYIEEMASQ